MNQFLLVFHNTPQTPATPPSPEQMQGIMKKWMDWIGGIGAQNKLVSPGNALRGTGAVVRSNNVVTNGPYVEVKEVISGFTIVKAESLEEAIALAEGCPIFDDGGAVEVRPIVEM